MTHNPLFITKCVIDLLQTKRLQVSQVSTVCIVKTCLKLVHSFFFLLKIALLGLYKFWTMF